MLGAERIDKLAESGERSDTREVQMWMSALDDGCHMVTNVINSNGRKGKFQIGFPPAKAKCIFPYSTETNRHVAQSHWQPGQLVRQSHSLRHFTAARSDPRSTIVAGSRRSDTLVRARDWQYRRAHHALGDVAGQSEALSRRLQSSANVVVDVVVIGLESSRELLPGKCICMHLIFIHYIDRGNRADGRACGE